MSLFIKGWKMPKTCSNCFAYDEEYKMCQLYSYGIVSRYPVQPYDKPKWCELIELPPHGRLVDADELLKDSETIILETIDDHEEVEEMIKYAPTIIEAEE